MKIESVDKINDELIHTGKIMNNFLQRAEFEKYLNMIVFIPLNEILKIEETLEIDEFRFF